jgi:TRAP-type C4-dicarboxylate transport system permease small subunit
MNGAGRRSGKDPVRTFCEAALALCVLAASTAVFAQVVYRYLLNDPVSWLDEFAVLCFAWIIMLGAAVVQADDAHMQIDSFMRPLSRHWQAAFYAFRFVTIAAVLVILIWYGWFLTDRMWFIEFPAMEISRGWLFAILPVCMPFVLYFLVRNAIRAYAVYRAGGNVFDTTHPDDVL